MSAAAETSIGDGAQAKERHGVPVDRGKSYKGFVAGAFSGMTKLAVGHPFVFTVCISVAEGSLQRRFDTVKVRLQTTTKAHFKGPLDCVMQTLRNEGVRGLYKGATPPLIGWMFMYVSVASVTLDIANKLGTGTLCNTTDPYMTNRTDPRFRLLGSLTVYRRLLNNYIFNPRHAAQGSLPPGDRRLPTIGHGIAGVFAGWTVSFIAAPIEHVKARLQIQFAADKSKRLYSGPIDCATKLVS